MRSFPVHKSKATIWFIRPGLSTVRVTDRLYRGGALLNSLEVIVAFKVAEKPSWMSADCTMAEGAASSSRASFAASAATAAGSMVKERSASTA